MSEKRSITKFIFKLNSNITISEMSYSIEEAITSLKRMWPHCKLELVSEEFSHFVGDYGNKTTKSKPVYSTSLQPAGRKSPMINKPTRELSLEDRLEQALVEQFGG